MDTPIKAPLPPKHILYATAIDALINAGIMPKNMPTMENRIDLVSNTTPGNNSHGFIMIAREIIPKLIPDSTLDHHKLR